MARFPTMLEMGDMFPRGVASVFSARVLVRRVVQASMLWQACRPLDSSDKGRHKEGGRT